ncbi:HTH domain-containing protein [Haloarchaeobius amylolyticus]|uniref:HTH domain-containing protein n=1 Tax=Haloarchaeobius amylolyticus TaxID=1198296 RepID=UPI00227199A6|nr:HTH domain-containing protein [Haloarchaeobius amylolyticus]
MTAYPPLTIDVYLRAYAPVSAPQETVLETVRDLRDDGLVASYDVHTWPSAVRADRSTTTSRHYERFRDWAAAEDVRIDQSFVTRRDDNLFTGETTERLRTPCICLAVRQDDELAAVLPCTVADGEHVTVQSYLESLLDGVDPLGTLDLADAEAPDDEPPERELTVPNA